ncbi:polyprenol dehydrogenase isoform X2 [Lepidochelys kempii]|uniref:polyprenol dehydrogenase isoform X2 n=1 Tax=Lepidochelys kempii TaxID=8472 RepID=UPI003C7018ED
MDRQNAGNDESEGQEAVRKIKEETVNEKGGVSVFLFSLGNVLVPLDIGMCLLEFLHCDLASMKSIRQFVQQFRAKNCPLHVLVNNAGVMLVPERKTEDGFEEHFGLNYLGHFLLTNLLLETLKQSGTCTHNARVITVSSATHYVGRLHLNDLQSRCSYSPHGAYAQSKLALVLFTYRLQHLITSDGNHVTANVVDPGVVNTELYKNVCWATKVVKWMTAWLFFKEFVLEDILLLRVTWEARRVFYCNAASALTHMQLACVQQWSPCPSWHSGADKLALLGQGPQWLSRETCTSALPKFWMRPLKRSLRPITPM